MRGGHERAHSMLSRPITSPFIAAALLMLAPAASSAASHYFPPSEFRDLKINLVPSFDDSLQQLGEPPLFDQQGYQFRFRATWISSFDGDATLRIEQSDAGDIRSVYKRDFPTEPNGLKAKPVFTRSLSRRALESLKSSIQGTNFSTLDNRQEVVPTDGTYLLIEVSSGTHYHAVYRVVPFAAPLDRIVEEAIRIAGARVDLNKPNVE